MHKIYTEILQRAADNSSAEETKGRREKDDREREPLKTHHQRKRNLSFFS